jgi:phosphatidylglycerophosphatase C
MKRNLALFDFDGTITKKDSFLEFIKYYWGSCSFYSGLILLLPVILLYKSHLIKNWRAKELVFAWFFRNEPYEPFRCKCRNFSLTVIPGLIKSDALKEIKKHIENGDKVIIISASFEDYLEDWCRSMNLGLIGTKIETKMDLLTGKLNGKNCYGVEKVIRLYQYVDISQFSEIYAYGDSCGDLPILEIADHRFFKRF